MQDLLGLGNNVVQSQSKTSSSSSQNSTFGIFGDIEMKQPEIDHVSRSASGSSQKSTYNIFGDFETMKEQPVKGNSNSWLGDNADESGIKEKFEIAQAELKKLSELLERNQFVTKEKEAELVTSNLTVKQLTSQIESDDNTKKQLQMKFNEVQQKYEESERIIHTKCAEIQKLDEGLQNQVDMKGCYLMLVLCVCVFVPVLCAPVLCTFVCAVCACVCVCACVWMCVCCVHLCCAPLCVPVLCCVVCAPHPRVVCAHVYAHVCVLCCVVCVCACVVCVCPCCVCVPVLCVFMYACPCCVCVCMPVLCV